MKVTSRHTYSAPPAVVFAAMTTPDVLIEKYTTLGHQDVKIIERTELAGWFGSRRDARCRWRCPVSPSGC